MTFSRAQPPGLGQAKKNGKEAIDRIGCVPKTYPSDAVMESPKLAEFRPGHPGLAIQVEVAA
jgi:hypothetical protein